MRLIDADALMEQLVSKHAHSWGKVERAYGEAIEALCNVPTVDAEPVRHGEWIHLEDDEYLCSACKTEFTIEDFDSFVTNHCPNCGAKMDGGKQDGAVQP